MTVSILDSLDPKEDYFDAAQALYWYGADYHGGQSSELYSIMSTMDYRPGMAERGPEPGSTAEDIYQALESGEVEPVEVKDWYEAGYDAAHEGQQ